MELLSSKYSVLHLQMKMDISIKKGFQTSVRENKFPFIVFF